MQPTSSNIYPLGSLFPKEAYNKAGARMALHFLIATGQPKATVLKWMKSHPKFLNHSSQEYYNLTPLAVSIMKGNREITEALLGEGADPKLADYKGWTPLHHAAVIGDAHILNMLIQKIGSAVATQFYNIEKGNYQDLQQLIQGRPLHPQDPGIYCHQEEGKEAIELTSEKFKELIGVDYTPHMIVTQKGIAARWADVSGIAYRTPEIVKVLEKTFERYLQRPPKLSIGENSALPNQFHIFTEEDLEAYQGIAIYAGELVESPPSNLDYYFMGVNGEKVRNCAPMINDSFPNCMSRPVFYKGLDYFFFITLRPIKKGEMLHWNYTFSHSIKTNINHVELNPEELENYVRQHSVYEEFIESTKPILVENLDIEKATYRHMERHEKVAYLLDTPSAWIHLLAKNLFPAEEMAKIFSLEEEAFASEHFAADQFQQRKQFVNICKDLDTFLKTCSGKETTEGLKSLFLTWKTQYNTAYLMTLFSHLNLLVDDPAFTNQSWETQKKELEHFVNFSQPLHQVLMEKSQECSFVDVIMPSFEQASFSMKKRMMGNFTLVFNHLNKDQQLTLGKKLLPFFNI